MRILILGGTGKVGSVVASKLIAWGHDVTVFHRGNTNGGVPDPLHHLLGDRRSLTDHRSVLNELSPDIIVDMIGASADDVCQLLDVFSDSAQRIVFVSSISVYRAYARFNRTEPGPPDLVPLLEDDPLCSVSDGKVAAEGALAEALSRSTILRLPFVYGSNISAPDRFVDYLTAMKSDVDDIILPPDVAAWRCATGYAPDMGYAIALAAKNSKAAGKIYNIADSFAFTQLDFARAIARATDWTGAIHVGAQATLEPLPYDYEQHLFTDTSAIRKDLGYAEETPINEALRMAVRAHPSPSPQP